MDAEGSGLFVSGGMATVMAVGLLLQASDDERALAWGLVFAGLAVIQFARLFDHQRSSR
jgi:hypothetical protein